VIPSANAAPPPPSTAAFGGSTRFTVLGPAPAEIRPDVSLLNSLAANHPEKVRGTMWEMWRICYHVFIDEARPWSGIDWYIRGKSVNSQMKDYTP
jgi:hypothetical protein